MSSRRPDQVKHIASPPQTSAEEALLVDRYRQLLRAAIVKVVPHAMAYERDDVEQDACGRLLGAVRKGATIANMDSYVYRIGVTTAIDSLRRIKRRRETALDDVAQILQGSTAASNQSGFAMGSSNQPDELAHRRQQLDHARLVIGQLSSNRQAVVVLHLKGFTIEETATKMGWTEAKTRNLIYRGMAEVRKKCQSMSDRES